MKNGKFCLFDVSFEVLSFPCVKCIRSVQKNDGTKYKSLRSRHRI